ncbi:Mettl7b protein [Salpingoeca rosetta]|uniref:Mettl7b protein n=1 Tax=Salpingoeca rosetta (strain ATCC 50818 / BSB-021) TaxID=946362 RepID=F2U4A0_SALR5|nr:Mettl7b protein [Salpingoeca rosetta]EGD82466.1 Mettl7b protein [Salpingoeca rosetta]|eukprot:XP_004995702.1 Mettl7b protein [Salpingoeca rosetta]
MSGAEWATNVLGAVGGAAVGALALGAVVCRLNRNIADWVFARIWLSMSDEVDKSLKVYKRELFSSGLTGHVLEVGSGTGVNLKHYTDPQLGKDIESLTMLEPNERLYEKLEEGVNEASGTARFPIHTINDFFPSDAVATQQYDAIVFVLVLCSVKDLRETLHEAYRLLKPGGKLIFLEHVCPPRVSLKYLAALMISPLWTSYGDGCKLTRQTEEAIVEFDWHETEIERFTKAVPHHGLSLEWLANNIIMGQATK